MHTRAMGIQDLDQVSALFDQYRVFYGRKSELERAHNFVKERYDEGDTRLFVYEGNDHLLYGFAHLFPSFTSTGTSKVWILNDLYVALAHRRKNVAQSLLNHCIEYAKQTNRKKILLETGVNNIQAQALYEKMGFSKASSYNYEFLID